MDWWEWIGWGVGLLGAVWGLMERGRRLRLERLQRKAAAPWRIEHHKRAQFTLTNATLRPAILEGVDVNDAWSRAGFRIEEVTLPVTVPAGESVTLRIGTQWPGDRFIVRYRGRRRGAVQSWAGLRPARTEG